MLDRWTMKIFKHPLTVAAIKLKGKNVTANQVSLIGFMIGMLALPLLSLEWYGPALCCILLNRIADGLDGNIARLTTPTDAGGFLDIILDFIFYSAVVFGFALADPIGNGLAAAALIFSFIGTGCSFLAFGIMAERNKINNIHYANKGFYYLDGLAEGTETIIFLMLFCLFPRNFPLLAWIFASICYLTTFIRVLSGFRTLQSLK